MVGEDNNMGHYEKERMAIEPTDFDVHYIFTIVDSLLNLSIQAFLLYVQIFRVLVMVYQKTIIVFNNKFSARACVRCLYYISLNHVMYVNNILCIL